MKAMIVRSAGAVGSAVAMFIALGLGCSPAAADELKLTTQPPDMVSGFIGVQYQYDAATHSGAFSAQGYAFSFATTLDQKPICIFDNTQTPFGSFGLAMGMTVDPLTGQPVNGTVNGTVTIGGTIPCLGATSGTLLKGELSQFGFTSSSDNGGIFEFVFNATGGDLMPQYYPGKFVLILDAVDSNFAGKFNTNFQNGGLLGLSDTSAVPVPGPSTVTMLLSLVVGGLIPVAWRCRPCGG